MTAHRWLHVALAIAALNATALVVLLTARP